MIDWSSMTAEEAHAAIQSRPVVMGPWRKSEHGRLWSRFEQWPAKVNGGTKHLCVQANYFDPKGDWSVSGLGAYGTYIMAPPNEKEALLFADQKAKELGWKLLDSSLKEGT